MIGAGHRPDTAVDATPLDDPIVNALTGRQRRFAQRHGSAIRFDPDVSVFYGHPTHLSASDWSDLAKLAGARGTPGVRNRKQPLPDGWRVLETFELVQYSGEAISTEIDDAVGASIVRLGVADVADILDLIERTRPGPFGTRTIELGSYLGIRDDDGALIAMAGERMRPQGWTEISAVCTAPHARGRGLATQLIRAVGAEIRARGDQPFLHTTADNPARGLYEVLGFTLRSEMPLEVLRAPGD